MSLEPERLDPIVSELFGVVALLPVPIDDVSLPVDVLPPSDPWLESLLEPVPLCAQASPARKTMPAVARPKPHAVFFMRSSPCSLCVGSAAVRQRSSLLPVR